MNRLPDKTIIIQSGIILSDEDILRLEIEMVDRGHLNVYDTLGYDENRNLVVCYGKIQFHDEIEDSFIEESIEEQLPTKNK